MRQSTGGKIINIQFERPHLSLCVRVHLIAAAVSHTPPPIAATIRASPSEAWTNGFASISSPMVLGTLCPPRARVRASHAALLAIVSFVGSNDAAHAMFRAVYSWPQNTSVRGGRAASFWNAASIIAAVPVLKFPAPQTNIVSPVKTSGAEPSPASM